MSTAKTEHNLALSLQGLVIEAYDLIDMFELNLISLIFAEGHLRLPAGDQLPLPVQRI